MSDIAVILAWVAVVCLTPFAVIAVVAVVASARIVHAAWRDVEHHHDHDQ